MSKVLLLHDYFPLTHGGMMNRCCLPLAATPSKSSKSALSILLAKSMAPVKLASMREDVTDFGNVTIFFETKQSKSH